MMILQKGKRRKMTKKVIRAITLMALYILSVACLSTNTLPDLVVTAFPTTTRMTSQNHVSKVMLHRTTKTQSSRLVALNNQVVTMEDAVEVSTSQNEDGIDTIFPVGSRVIRLPERGTRIRLFYPTTQEAAEAAEKGNTIGNDKSFEFAP